MASRAWRPLSLTLPPEILRKGELLRVLERPEIPLNTNASENDIRAFVTKRFTGDPHRIGRDPREQALQQTVERRIACATLEDAIELRALARSALGASLYSFKRR